eukprot:COSAG04_NODE_780_length_10315_cov_3.685033_10_plen_81_part_00
MFELRGGRAGFRAEHDSRPKLYQVALCTGMIDEAQLAAQEDKARQREQEQDQAELSDEGELSDEEDGLDGWGGKRKRARG